MMKTITTAGITLLMFSLTLMAGTNASVDYLYLSLDMPVAELPPGCVRSDLSPVEKTSRPLVLSTEKHIKAFCEGDFPGLLDYTMTKEMFILSFKEKNDIGVYGWRLASPEAADVLFRKASATYATRAEHMKLWRQKDLVVLLWRDNGVSDTCFGKFREHVERTLAKAK